MKLTPRASFLQMQNSVFHCVLSLAAALAPSVATAITVPTVPIGDVGNANDPAPGNNYGGVNYAYNIGTNEVTIGQYAAFLNAVAKTDTYNLYSINMATDGNTGGIAQAGESGSYLYVVIGSANRPITYVSWGDAARFANWLHNGQPTGAQNAGSTEDGAYTLNGAITGIALSGISRNANAKWFIPTEHEWYKAAYYQPQAAGGDLDNYWSFPTKSNTRPYSAPPPGSAAPTDTRVGNFNTDDFVANGYDDGYAITGSTSYSNNQSYLTAVGAYTSSPTYYGTFDQGGNVWE